MNGGHSRNVRKGWLKWPAIWALWGVYLLGRALAKLGNVGHDIAEWALRQMERL